MKKGQIVKFMEGFYRLSRVTKKTVNLRSVWGRTIYYKGLPKSRVVDAEKEFWDYWVTTDAYREA